MHRTTRPQASLDVEEKPKFNMLVAYEDLSSGRQALQVFNSLANHFSTDFEFNNRMWKFDALAVPRMKELAVRDASKSDMIVVALCSGNGDLPNGVKEWIEGWLERRQADPQALVALFQRHGRTARVFPQPSAENYLEQIARRACIDFFSNANPNTSHEISRILPPPEIEGPLLRQPLSLHADPYPRWGLNE